jgi:hypothetical protein
MVVTTVATARGLQDQPGYWAADQDGSDDVRCGGHHEEEVDQETECGCQAGGGQPACGTPYRWCVAAATDPADGGGQWVAGEGHQKYQQGCELEPG